MEYTVNFNYDDEADVWIATSPDIQGLVLESGSLDRLEERVRYAIPELLSLDKTAPKYLDMTFLSQRHERMLVNG